METGVSPQQDQAPSSAMPERRIVLFLQGLATPFFATLAGKLATRGHTVHRVHYCGADWLFRGEDVAGVTHHMFTGRMDTLAPFYRNLIAREGVDTIVLLGDCRPVHEDAVALAAELGLRLFAFDEGYIRPGFITMEAGGTNGHSRMPNTADGIERLFDALKEEMPKPGAPAPMDMRRRAAMDIAGHAANIAYRFRFRHYRGHRPAPLWREAFGWIRRGWNAVMYGAAITRTAQAFETTDTPYFLVPLQLNSDYQIRRHSRFSGMPAFIDEVIASFAAHAPTDCRLFFKNHPLDNGMIDYRALTQRLAAEHGLKGRVAFAAGGDLDTFLTKARGTVLVNSTVGFAALRLMRPLKVLGRAIYDIPGLSDQQPLDSFWQKPEAPQQRLAEKFLAVVQNYTQVRGDLFSQAGITQAAQEAVAVIEGTTPRLPAK